MAEFTQENFDKFLLDKSFPLSKKIENLYKPYQKDENGKDLDYNKGRKLVIEEAQKIIKDILKGRCLSSEPDWKQATVLLSLAELQYDSDLNRERVYKGRNYALTRLVRSLKCSPATEALEKQLTVTIFLRYINFSIRKEQEDIFNFYQNQDGLNELWEMFCEKLEDTMKKLKNSDKNNSELIKKVNDEIFFFKEMNK